MQDLVLRARLQFVADDPGAWSGARNKVDELSRSLTGLRGEMRTNMVTQTAFMQGMRQMGSFARHAAGDFGEFELILKRSEGLLGGMTQDLQRMRRFAMADRSTEFTPTQLAQGMLELVRAGSEGAETLRDIKTVADVATVAEYDLKQASVAVANAQQAWGGGMMSTRDIMTRFVNAANASTFELGNLVQAMGLAQGSALAYDQSLTTTLANLSMLAPVTGANTKAATAFAASMRAVGDAKKQSKLKGLGVKLIDEDTGGFRPIQNIIADFIDKTSKMATEKGAALTKAIFGERGTRNVAAIMRVMERGVIDVNGQFVTGRAAIEAWNEKVRQGKMSLSEQADLARESLPMRWAQLKANTQRMFIEMGEKLAPALKAIVSGLTSLAGAIEYVFSGKLGTVLMFTGGILALKAAVGGVAFVLERFAPSLAAMRGGVAGALPGAAGAAAPLAGGGAGLAGAAAQGFLANGLLHHRNAWVDGRIASAQGAMSQTRAGLGWSTVANSAAGNTMASAAARTGGMMVSAGSRVLGFVGGLASAVTSPLALLTGGIWAAAEAIDYFRKRAAARKEKEEKYQLIGENFGLVGKAIGEMYNKGGVSPFTMQSLEAHPMLKWALGSAMSNIAALQGQESGVRKDILAKSGFASEGQFALASVASALKSQMIKEEIPETTRAALMDQFLRSAKDLEAHAGKKLALERVGVGDKVTWGELGSPTDPARGVVSALRQLTLDPMQQFGGAAELGATLKNLYATQGVVGGGIVTAMQTAFPGLTPEGLAEVSKYVLDGFMNQLRQSTIELSLKDDAGRIIQQANAAKLKFPNGLPQ